MSILECDVEEVKEYIRQFAREDGLAEGLQAGQQLGEARALFLNVHALMESFHLTLEEACNGLHISVEKYYASERLIKEHCDKNDNH